MKIVFISNKETESLGYFYDDNSIENLVNSIDRTGLEMDVFYANDVKSLENFLAKGADLVLPNIYTFIDQSNNQEVWLTDVLEKLDIPYIGHNKQGLMNVLDKGKCQSILNENNISIPKNVVLEFGKKIDKKYLEKIVSYPVIVKPVAACTSEGIHENSVSYDSNQIIQNAHKIFDEMGQNVIVEEYLEGLEMSTGIIKSNDKKFVISGIYNSNIVRDETVKHIPFFEGEIQMINDEKTRYFLENVAEKVYDALGLRDIARFDSRFDSQGNIKIFDVNGMPGMNMGSSLPTLTYLKEPNEEREVLYDSIVNSLIMAGCERNNIPVPYAFQEKNLFNLNKQNEIAQNYAN